MHSGWDFSHLKLARYGRLLQVHMLSVESMRSKISPAFVLRGVDLLPTRAFRRDGGGGAAGQADGKR